MKKTLLISVAALGLGLLAGAAHATNAAQDHMKSCSADFKASGKPTSERQAFMKECLAAKPAAAASAAAPAASMADKSAMSAQERMKACSADFRATGKPSSERQAYMKDCLKK
ncbi:MAG: phosphate starvation-inducible protein PsiF [Pelomonas sp.]|nr:phosphate starvation-inducible protein PsiF [Roseateles sp.]